MSAPAFRKLLVANRGEIAIRVFRAATELASAPWRSIRMRTASPCTASRPTKVSLIGSGKGPVGACLDSNRGKRPGVRMLVAVGL